MDDFRFPWAVDWGWGLNFTEGGRWVNGKAVMPAGREPKRKSRAKGAATARVASASDLKNSLSNAKISALTPKKATFKVGDTETSGFKVGDAGAVFKKDNKWAYGSYSGDTASSFGDISENFVTKADAVAALKKRLREQSDFGK